MVITLLALLSTLIARRALRGLLRHRRMRAQRAAAVPASRKRGRAGAVIIVIALVAGVSLLGSPAYAQEPFNPFDCKPTPEPEWPYRGLVAVIDPPYAGGGGEYGSVRAEVHYGGLIWHTYDLGCTPNPMAAFDTWMGNQTFNVAKAIVGATTFVHYQIEYSGDTPLADFDDIVGDGVRAMWDSVFVRWASLALLILAITVLFWSLNGNLAKQTQRVALGLVALTAAGASYLAPTTWSSALDEFMVDGTKDVINGFFAADVDPVSAIEVVPTLLHDTVIYENWVRGEFGASDINVNGVPALDYGRELLRTQVFVRNEVYASAEEGADYDYLGVIEAKKKRFVEIADSLGPYYGTFKGEEGSRIGVGLLAVFQAICLCLFQLIAKAMLFVTLIIVRLVVIAMPAVAVAAIVQPAILRSILRIVGVAAINGLMLAALAGLHGMILYHLFGAGTGQPAGGLAFAMMTSLIVSALMWAIARPIKRITAMARMVGGQIGLEHDPNTGVRRELRRQRRKTWKNLRKPRPGEDDDQWWRGGDKNDTDNSGRHQRPEETAGTVYATATRLDNTSRQRGARPHGGRPTEAIPPGPPMLPAGNGVHVIPGSGRTWAQDPPIRPGISGPPHRREIGPGAKPSRDTSTPLSGRDQSPNAGASRSLPAGEARPDRTPPAEPTRTTRALPGTHTQTDPPARMEVDTTETSQPGSTDVDPPTVGPGLGARRSVDSDRGSSGPRPVSEPIYDSDQQAVVYDQDSGPQPRMADMYTDNEGRPVYMLYDPDSGRIQRDELPPQPMDQAGDS